MILILFSGSAVCAQTITNQTNVYIPAGMTVRIGGDMVNKGFFQNNGTFSLDGSLGNTGVYQGSGIISLDGTDQTIQTNSQSIGRLVVNGGGIKTISNKVVIAEAMDLNEGVLLVADADTLLLQDGCEITGGSQTSYVDGAITTAGTGFRFFPVGKNGAYHPATFDDVKGLNPVIAVELEENLPSVQTTPAATVMGDVYWTRKTISGTFESSPITLTYPLNDTINQERVAIAEAALASGPFTLLENVSLLTSGSSDVIGSRKEATGNIFAIAELLNDPARPYYLSTTLSPNAVNPENRTVKLFGAQISENAFLFQVFNRWGITVYETESLQSMKANGWDGRQHGSVVASGAYPYSLKYSDLSGKTVQQTGFIIVVH